MASSANDERDERCTDTDTSEHDDDSGASPRWRTANRERRGPQRAPRRRQARATARVRRGPTRAARQGTEEFKCGQCRAFIGPTIGGGRHRNHCPLCLHSRHVDRARPGDRASDCRASMAPIARFDRPGGESVIVHRCLGCGLERHNRLVADDNLALLIRLPLVAPRIGRVPEDGTVSGEGITTHGTRPRHRGRWREVS